MSFNFTKCFSNSNIIIFLLIVGPSIFLDMRLVFPQPVGPIKRTLYSVNSDPYKQEIWPIKIQFNIIYNFGNYIVLIIKLNPFL